MQSADSPPGGAQREPAQADRPWYRSDALGAGALGFVVLFVLTGVAVTLSPPGNKQPIAFNHRKHVEENGMECSECHEFYEKETFSGLPGAETCSFCHQEPLGESAEEQKLVKLLEEEAPLEWTSLFRQPPHVFYSHRRHVVVAQMECADCHGAIEESSAPPERVKQLTMDECVDCHQKEGARADCNTCHR